MANDINRAARTLLSNPRVIAEIIHTQSSVRELSEAVVVDSRGNTVARTGFGFSLDLIFPQTARQERLNNRPGEVIIIRGGTDDRVVAGVKLEAYADAYLLVGRFVKPRVLDHLSRTRGATAQYSALEQNRESLQLKFLMVLSGGASITSSGHLDRLVSNLSLITYREPNRCCRAGARGDPGGKSF